MDSLGKHIQASGPNPFDRTYSPLQLEYDNRIIKMLSEILKVNITLVNTPLVTDLQEYEKDPDIWVLEQILNGTAEMSSASLILMSDSSKAVRYSQSIGTFRPQLYFKAKSLREDSNIYLIPFSINLWFCLILAILLLTLTLTFILSRESKLPHKISYDVFARLIDIQEDRDEDWSNNIQNTTEESLLQREKWEMGEILLVSLGAVCQQGSARDPSTNAARLLLLVLFMLAVVGYTAYSASIISLISLFPSTEHEESHTPKHYSKEYKTLLHSTNKITDYLEWGFNDIEYTSLTKGFEKAFKGDAVFVGDRDVSLTFLHQQNYISDLRCSLGRAFLGVEYHRVFAMRNQSKYPKIIDQSILRLKQFGLLQREKKRIFNVEPPCTLKERSSRSSFLSFGKNDVKPLLNLFQYGVITSIFLLAGEYFLYYCPKRIRKMVPNWSTKNVFKKSNDSKGKRFNFRQKTKKKVKLNKETNVLFMN